VARLNFSHGSHQEHADRIQKIRQVAHEEKKTVGILLDTKGPEIRTGDLKNVQIRLEEGQPFILTTDEIQGDHEKVSITYPDLPNELAIGTTILIDDGLIELVVEETTATEIRCRVKNGGILKSKKGVNIPGVKIN